ncbi:hypothetical protein B0H66DRAFT_543120 [Apodospora peruviana]|uniref:Uncharacterized protein n=1 Tax=Apodospora peruviana TaxID=516989 RepID=A0AAE0IRZ5_9PEZI|nr:hypothetical protein B0H66DRAFT_543120 [Apodospora peruviana]
MSARAGTHIHRRNTKLVVVVVVFTHSVVRGIALHLPPPSTQGGFVVSEPLSRDFMSRHPPTYLHRSYYSTMVEI